MKQNSFPKPVPPQCPVLPQVIFPPINNHYTNATSDTFAHFSVPLKPLASIHTYTPPHLPRPKNPISLFSLAIGNRVGGHHIILPPLGIPQRQTPLPLQPTPPGISLWRRGVTSLTHSSLDGTIRQQTVTSWSDVTSPLFLRSSHRL